MKPPYKIPSMAEIKRIRPNGLKVVSTFAGGGGSSTGWRVAGFKVAWANEFMPPAQKVYAANHPGTILDPRDIKKVNAVEILERTGLNFGELDVLDGSPPCQGFSIANQNRMKGEAKTYDNGESQVNEDMFFEYVRLLRGLMPKVFVAENVKGLTMGKAKGVMGDFQTDMFQSQENTILHALMDSGYVVRYQILNSADYGTPQSRPGVFFIGVRKDLNKEPVFPVKLPYQYAVIDALPHLGEYELHWIGLNGFNQPCQVDLNNPSPTIRASDHKRFSQCLVKIGIGYGMGYKENGSFPRNITRPLTEPIQTIQKMSGIAGGVPVSVVAGEEKRKFTIGELKRLGGFPDDYDLDPAGSYARQWEIVGNSVTPPQMAAIGKCLYEGIFK